MNEAQVIEQFEKANLDILFAPGPIDFRAQNIFQMDIQRLKDEERFRVWPGADTQLQVTGVNPTLRQLVLHVKEPRRRFERALSKAQWKMMKEQAQLRGIEAQLPKVIAEETRKYGNVIVEEWTTNAQRRFLCGHDEIHLFIAQFTRGSSVKEAHDALNPKGANRPGTARQGEWFFAVPNEYEQAALESHIKRHPYSVAMYKGIADGIVPRTVRAPGTPHVAQELVFIPRSKSITWDTKRREWVDSDLKPIREGRRIHGTPVRIIPADVYVRGTITHPRHSTVTFHEWRKVFHNLEINNTTMGGILWVD